MKTKRAFTLIELLVVIAIIAILIALVLPVDGGKTKTIRTQCMSNVRQINLGILIYLEDQTDNSPGHPGSTNTPFLSWTDYRGLVQNTLGLKGPPSPDDRVFACPSDTFYYDLSKNGAGYVPRPMHEQSNHAYASYSYNAAETTTRVGTNTVVTNRFGIAGQKLDSVRHPSRTILIAETPAFAPYSWHQPKKPFSRENAFFNDARDMLGFVDGHASMEKIYWNSNAPNSLAVSSDPPPAYDYQWSGD